MAPVVTSLQTGAAPSATKEKLNWRRIPKAKRATLLYQPPVHTLNGTPKLRWVKPLAKQARRDMSNNKTTRLISKRKTINTILPRRSQRAPQGLSAQDWLLRKQILQRVEAYAKRRRRHTRPRTMAMNETEKIYRWDPSTERAVEIDLISPLLCKSRRPLGPDLENRERPLKASEAEADHDNTSSSGPKGDETHPIVNMDGAFDDLVRAQSKKRKPADGPTASKPEQVQRKKARKEQAGPRISQTPVFTLKCQPDQPDTSTQDREADSIGGSTPLNSMSQSKKSKFNNVSNQETAVKVDRARANGAKGNGSKGCDGDSTNKSKVNGGKVHAETTRASASNKSKSYSEPAVEPWYMIHARRMMEPDFDDFVRNRSGRPKPVSKKFIMSGALPISSRKFVSGALPSPPTSSSSSSPDRKKRVESTQKELNFAKNKEDAPRPHSIKNKKNGAKARGSLRSTVNGP